MRKSSLPTVVMTHPLLPELIRAELAPHVRIVLARTRGALLREIPRAQALITLLSDAVDAKLLARAPLLKVVANYAVGLNNIDQDECRRRGIRVVNTPDVLTRATAELTLTLLLATARRVPEGDALCRKGKFKGWAPELLLGLELRGRHAVLVGRGRIGTETARLFEGIGMTTEFLTRTSTPKEILGALPRAQVLSLHMPLTPETRHWLDGERLAQLPQDAIVLNTTRGPTVDERALIAALRKRAIFGAGLDVFEREPAIPLALRKLPNAVLLPHLGSATRPTREAMVRLVIQGVLQTVRKIG